ncbi:hypothetical protein MYCTH_2107194 [Thermothelomyces thermophilus ATCC 42464]|uniref:Uncharacterized protein n=1 Tax=Thermothelomyces thermophilus (strain ATCC 42464 / BCRC 31852 / DSM 1799) TaxID=573729 RepID=G2Q461_THET4|nr:uncharacterized protein MYCTH_2107194 [Thermothelomyces thermophilus ATCC 42464]AEO54456.1 hypothetical protein MYCTH_2107194 [Thermothelomyces thermophilus ATCC 42464]
MVGWLGAVVTALGVKNLSAYQSALGCLATRQGDCQYAFVCRLASELEEVESMAYSGYYPRVPYSGPLYVVATGARKTRLMFKRNTDDCPSACRMHVASFNCFSGVGSLGSSIPIKIRGQCRGWNEPAFPWFLEAQPGGDESFGTQDHIGGQHDKSSTTQRHGAGKVLATRGLECI